MKGSVLEFSGVKPLPFNGTVSPIAFVPNWLNSANSNKSLRFEDISLSEFVALPFYNPDTLQNASTSDKIALLSRGTFITLYMGSYRMNFAEYDGSHLGVDIRAPLGTPVVSIANGVITKVVNSEGADGKYVVIRHDGISYDGSSQDSYYSAYLHLESISVVE